MYTIFFRYRSIFLSQFIIRLNTKVGHLPPTYPILILKRFRQLNDEKREHDFLNNYKKMTTQGHN